MGENVANDFAAVIEDVQNSQKVPRDLPPLHPKEKEQWVNLAEDDPLPGMNEAADDHNLLSLPKRKLKAKYERYSFDDPQKMERLEEIQSLCLQAGSGYYLAREEWTTDKDGDTFILIKYLMDEKSTAPETAYVPAYKEKESDDGE